MNMFIKFLCISCGHKLKAAMELAGKRARCTRCSRSVTIPGPEADPLSGESELGQQPIAHVCLPASGQRKTSSVFVAALPPPPTPVKESVFAIWLGGVVIARL
jgi:hypothetical protein